MDTPDEPAYTTIMKSESSIKWLVSNCQALFSMWRHATIFGFMIVLLLSACKSTNDPEEFVLRQPSIVANHHMQAVNDLLGKIRSQLPKGWAVSYDKKYGWLEVDRDEAALAQQTYINMNPDDMGKPIQIRYGFAFRVEDAVSPTKYHRLKVENAKIQKQVIALCEDLEKRHVYQKFDSFLASTPSEEVVVARYNSLKNSLHHLPDFYFRNISLSWGGLSLSEETELYIIDDKIREECEQVRQNVVKLLSKYDDA